MRIRIIKVPDGPAPGWVRENWVGITLTAIPMPKEGIECDFISEELLPSRGGYVVEKNPAFEALARKSIPAAEWFNKHFPSYSNYLCFEPDEAEVVGF
jgi:hypothetical protein